MLYTGYFFNASLNTEE